MESGKSVVTALDLGTSPTVCGYCKQVGSVSQGLVLESLTVRDYKALLDRGWRRSGRYVYKPVMEETCCPLYTIRCQADRFTPTKSQRKVIRKVKNYIHQGAGARQEKEPHTKRTRVLSEEKEKEEKETAAGEESTTESANHRRIEGLLKSKQLRKQKYFDKLLKAGEVVSIEDNQNRFNRAKDLKELVPEQNSFLLNTKILQSEENSKHKFELRLVKADLNDSFFMSSLQESYRVYRSYQTKIHHDKPYECDIQTFAGFLCDSPLVYEREEEGRLVYGSYHHQYLVDGAVVMVAVLDLLPGCVSSVYLYYDPDWWGQCPGLSPGTYSALREVQLTRDLGLGYYYMGFYIHTVSKMRYKGRFLPSDLLSPSLLSWHDITRCSQILDKQKLDSFHSVAPSQEPPPPEVSDVDKLQISYNDKSMTYAEYKKQCNNISASDIEKYHDLVGQSLSEKMLLHRRGFYYLSDSEED